MGTTSFKNVTHFDTEKQAERAKRRFKKYKGNKSFKWVVQGNSLVKIPRRSK